MLTKKELFTITWWPVVIASLCCLGPVILVLLGISTVAFAASLADVWYGEYKWWFRLAGLLLLGLSVFFFLRRQKGICTIDEAKQRRNEIINIISLVLIAAVLGYIVWLYIVVEIIGIILGLWGFS